MGYGILNQRFGEIEHKSWRYKLTTGINGIQDIKAKK